MFYRRHHSPLNIFYHHDVLTATRFASTGLIREHLRKDAFIGLYVWSYIDVFEKKCSFKSA